MAGFEVIESCNLSTKLWDLSAIIHDFLFSFQWMCFSSIYVICNQAFAWYCELAHFWTRSSKSIRKWEYSIRICPVEGPLKLPIQLYQIISVLSCVYPWINVQVEDLSFSFWCGGYAFCSSSSWLHWSLEGQNIGARLSFVPFPFQGKPWTTAKGTVHMPVSLLK